MHKSIDLYMNIAQHSNKNAFDQPASHFHNHYEIYFLISGRRRYVIDNEIYDIEAGDIVLIPPMVMHKTQRIPGTLDEEKHERFLYCIQDIPEVTKPVFEKYLYRPDEKSRVYIKDLVEESLNEKGTDEASILLHKLNVQKILLILLKSPENKNVPRRLSQRDRLMQDAASFIKENCHKQISLKDISDRIGFTPEYFSLVFKTAIGFNFVDYLNNMRIAKALSYLTETHMSISAISEMCGFNDSNYFAIVFKKVTGISPTKYRKTIREKNK